MALMTIGQVSEKFGISARMLRYYEKEGLIESRRRDNYAYRMYDEDVVRKIRQIILLRRLQMPLKKIRILLDGSSQEVASVIKEQMREGEQGIASMRTIQKALGRLGELLEKKGLSGGCPWESEIDAMTCRFSPERYQLKGSADFLAAEKEKQIRIILLPPYTVASYRCFGEAPEEKVGNVMDAFIRRERLYEKKSDSRLFGFNPTDSRQEVRGYSYENWVTIPEDMEVPAPLSKKHFPGGLYAAYAIQFPEFQEWEFLKGWIKRNGRYRMRCCDDRKGYSLCCLEEHLNWVYSAHAGWPRNGIDGSIDLLLPIEPRNPSVL